MRRPLEPELRDIGNLRAIAAAVRARDVQAARTAARRHIEIGRAAMDKALGGQK
jgi:DNA-binding GntR family transcriptional regulator